MNDNYLREKANCLRNEMKHLWGAMFITGGGAIGFAVIETTKFMGILLHGIRSANGYSFS